MPIYFYLVLVYFNYWCIWGRIYFLSHFLHLLLFNFFILFFILSISAPRLVLQKRIPDSKNTTFSMFPAPPLLSILTSTFSRFFGVNRMTYLGRWGGDYLITSCVLCIAPPAPPPSGPPSTLTPGGSSTLSKKRPPPPPPGHKRTLSDPPSPLSHSPHSKGGLTGGEMQSTRVNRRAGFTQERLQPEDFNMRVLTQDPLTSFLQTWPSEHDAKAKRWSLKVQKKAYKWTLSMTISSDTPKI